MVAPVADSPRTPSQNATNARIHDENTRICFQALGAGKTSPTEARENCGRWQSLVDLAASYASRANPSAVPKILKNILEDNEELKTLLQEKGPEPEQQESASGSGKTSPHIEDVRSQGDEMPPLPESARQPTGLLPSVSPWLNAYIAYSSRLSPEGFRDFHLACGLWVLSTVAARRIQVPLADPVITPLSLLLVGRTSLFAKTTTAKAGMRLLRAAHLGFLTGDDETTPQRLLYDMAGHLPSNYGSLSLDEREEILARIAFSAQRGTYIDEFNQLLNAMMRPGPMADFSGLLRKLDNCMEEYRYSTKSGGQEKIRFPYLALLGSTTPANLAKHAGRNSEFWNDGFWARVLFVCPPPHDFVTRTMEDGIVNPSPMLIDPLVAWHERLGIPHCEAIEEVEKEKPTGHFRAVVDPLPITTLHIDPNVITAFNAYRVALRQLVAEDNGTQDLDGSYSRLPTQALRIAALLASLEHQDRITKDIWALAQEIAETFRRNLHELYAQVTSGIEENSSEDLLLSYLKTRQGELMTVREIRQFANPIIRKLKSDHVRDMLLGLEKSGIVQLQREGRIERYGLAS